MREWWGYLKAGAPVTAMAAFFASLAWPWVGMPTQLVLAVAFEYNGVWVAAGIWLVFFCTFVGYFQDRGLD